MLAKLGRLVILAAISTVVVSATATIPAAGESSTRPPYARARVADGSCPDFYAVAQWVCIWSRKGFSGTKWEFDSGTPSFSSLGHANDRGVSIVAKGSYQAIRLYRDTDFYGAWVCIPLRRSGVRWLYDLRSYVFNNGAGRAGYGQVVARNFKSMGFSTSRCTSPI